LRKAKKALLYLVLGVLGLLIIAFIFINTRTGKRFVRDKVQTYLANKLQVNVSISEIDYSLPSWISLKGLYIEDRKKDTLVFGDELRVDIKMLKLIRGETDIRKVLLRNLFARISRPAGDSSFNYQFIIDAFDSGNESGNSKDSSALKISLGRLIIEKTNLVFEDAFGGVNMKAGIDSLDLSLNKFQPDKLLFAIKELKAGGINFSMLRYKSAPLTAIAISSEEEQAAKLDLQSDGIVLSGVSVLIEDKVTGLYYSNDINKLEGSGIYFNLASQSGSAIALKLDSGNIVFHKPNPGDTLTLKNPDTINRPWTFNVKKIEVNQSAFQYNDNSKPVSEGLDLAHLDTKNINASISSFVFAADTTAVLVNHFGCKDKSGFSIDTTHADFRMTNTGLSVKELYLQTPNSLLRRSFEMKFDSLSGITKIPQNTLVTAGLEKSVIAFNDIYLLVPSLKKTLPVSSFSNQSMAINTALKGSLQTLNIPYLQLSGLSGSSLNARAVLHNLADPNRFAYELYILESRFLKIDLIRFLPPEQLASLDKLPPVFNLQGKISGDKNNMEATVSAKGDGVGFTGSIKLNNISDPKKMNYGLAISNATVNKELIASFMPPDVLKKLELPSSISASGKFNGNADDITTDMKLASGFGPVTIKGYIKNIKDSLKVNYDLLVSTPGFLIGKLIKQDSVLGSVAGSFKAKGTGFDYKKMKSSFEADIAGLQYKQYNYRNALLSATLDNGLIQSKGSINDSSLRVQYELFADVRNKYPVINASFDIDTALLKNLHVTDSLLNVSGKMQLRSKSLEPGKLDASLVMDGFRVRTPGGAFPIDSLSLQATSYNGIDSINLWAPFADIRSGGVFEYDKIGLSVQQYVSRYYKIPGTVQPGIALADQQFGIKGVIYPDPLYNILIPGFQLYEPVTLEGNYASAASDSALNFTLRVPRLKYQAYTISQANISLDSRNEHLTASVTYDTLQTASSIFYNSVLNVAAAHDSLTVSARTKDKKKKDWFGIKGDVVITDGIYRFRISDSTLLNYEKWKSAPDNYIEYSPAGIIVNNFLLTSDTAKIFMSSDSLIANSPVNIEIDNFNLKNIGALVNRDTMFVSGILDVKAKLSELEKPLPAFTGTADVLNLKFMEIPVGNIQASAQKQGESSIDAKISLTGNNNDASLEGNYYLTDTARQFNADLDIRKLNFKTIEAFSSKQLTNSSGNVHGKINIHGKFADPRWAGAITLDTTSFTATQLGSPFKINNQSITFEHPAIKFNDFIIKDSLGHTFKLDGDIKTMDNKELALNLDMNAYDFIFMNAKKSVNNKFYGYAAADANVSVTGTSVSPSIEGDIYVNNKSNFAIVLPEDSYGEDDGNTIVRFIDLDTFNLESQMKGFEEAKISKPGFGKYLFYNLNIEIDKESSLTIIVDPNTGDEVSVQGDAQLNAGVDPGGNLVLAGTYELDKGYYVLNYQFLQRKFELQKGSTISFSGPAQDADININAVYVIKTSAKDLIGNEVSDVNPALLRSFNQELPFRVMLNLTGKLTKPNISFDILLPEQSNLLSNEMRSTIETKLAQVRLDPAATNKQVFSLLILGKFVGEQSSDFFKGNGTDFSSVARQSVSQFLSSALNEIAGDIFKGIDVDLNLNTYNDFVTGAGQERTDLNVAVSKSFLDDRLTVTVGKNFGVDGEDPAAKASRKTSGFRPDVTLAYKLSKDGKYLVRAYTKDQFEVILDGYVIENGVSFVVTMDYDKFKELFSVKKRKKG
jgi:hypothetical protein